LFHTLSRDGVVTASVSTTNAKAPLGFRQAFLLSKTIAKISKRTGGTISHCMISHWRRA
jgi:hypothetical protein